MNSSTYIAVTIGPIYKTFSESKRTRSVWAASYFFSWFMRRFVERAKDQGIKIFLPYTSELIKGESYLGFKGKYGAGLYADRLYFLQQKESDIETIREILNDLFYEVENKSNKEIPIHFLKDYLNIHIIKKAILSTEVNHLSVLNSTLDNRELLQNANFEYEYNPLQEYFNKKTNSESFLALDAFGQDSERQFKSITEIATNSLKRKDSTVYNKILRDNYNSVDEDFLKSLSTKFEIFPYHKYIAVIYADGDNIGEVLKFIQESNKDFGEFSKALFDFGIVAEEEIAAYGGNGIYLGGEDVLVFAPIACIDKQSKKLRTIFSLIKKLDEKFEETIGQYVAQNFPDLKVKPTMSYGVMMAYYKNPLKNTMSQAHELLEQVKNKGVKNEVSVKLQKHSGQYITCTIGKNKSETYLFINSLIENYCSRLYDEKNMAILTSIVQKFRDEEFWVLYYKASQIGNLEYLYKNFFNENIHKDGQIERFLLEVKTLTEMLIKDNLEETEIKDIIYTVFRFIHFINSKRD